MNEEINDSAFLEEQPQKPPEPKQIQIPGTYIAAFAAAFFVLLFLFASLHALGFPTPYNVLKSLSGFNLLHLGVSSVGAVYVADTLRRRLKKLDKHVLGTAAQNFFRACVCVLIAFLLEITVLQYNHYGTANGYADVFGWEDLSSSMQNVSVYGEPVFFGDASQNSEGVPPAIEFGSLNMRVASVHVEPNFDAIDGLKTMSCYVMFTDEQLTDCRTPEYTIVKGAAYTEYIPVYPVGEVSDLTVVFTSNYAAFSNVAVNEPIPLTPVTLRILIIAGLIFAAGTLRRYNVFAVKFDAANKRQKVLFAALLALCVAYCEFTAVAGYVPGVSDSDPTAYRSDDQYNHLADAFAAGRLNIEVGFDAAALDDAERPYDQYYRIMNRIPHPFDAAVYNGKFYVYAGAVPCVMLYLPYNLITGGKHLPGWIASFFFCSAAVIFLSLAWREAVKKLFPNIPLITFLLGSFALTFCSFAPFIAVMPRQYEVAVLSALAFVALGLYLLFKFAFSQNKRFVALVFSCLSFALAVGCRPTTVFWSVLVPIFVWSEVKNKSTRIKTILAVALPYVVIALPIMWYNYARFESITEFGVTHMLAAYNYQALTKNITPAEFMYFLMMGSFEGHLFKLPNIMSDFPFVTTVNISVAHRSLVEMFDSGVVGILTLPVVWFTAKIRSVSQILNEASRKLIRMAAAGWGVCLLIAVIGPIIGGVVVRYSVDFMWFPVLTSLVIICALLYKHSEKETRAITEKLSCAAILASGLIGFTSTFVGACAQIMNVSPHIYFYLKRAMTFFAGV